MAQFWMFLSMIVAVWFLPGFNTMLGREQLVHDVAQLAAENTAMAMAINEHAHAILALRHNPDYQEHVIRDEMGWVRDDEMVLVLSERPP